ncbi:MAG: M23 family metallopeptidase, partial [Chloroflexota bacterium]
TRPASNTPDSRIAARSTYTPYPPAVFPTGDAGKLKKPPASVTNEPHLIFDRPVPNSAPSSQYRFGMTYDGRLAPHHGLDMAPVLGAMVGAAGPGAVFFAGPDDTQVFGTKENFYGNVVVLQMNETWEGHTIFTLYGHLDSVAVAAGQQVNTGDLIGIVGATGIAYGPHLHFEVRLDDPYSYFGSVRNPELWYRPLNGGGVIAGRLINAEGRFIPGARVFITCKDALRFVDTYWDQGTPPDNVLVENFAMSDIPQGNCNLETTVNGKLYHTSVYVPPGEVAFVVIQTEDK